MTVTKLIKINGGDRLCLKKTAEILKTISPNGLYSADELLKIANGDISYGDTYISLDDKLEQEE